MLGLALVVVGLVIVAVKFLLSLAPLLIVAGAVLLAVGLVRRLLVGRRGRHFNRDTFSDWP